MSAMPTILTTACSSGIGAVLAQDFARRGHQVIATASGQVAIEPLKAKGGRTLALDVTSAKSIAALVQTLKREPLNTKKRERFGLDRL